MDVSTSSNAGLIAAFISTKHLDNIVLLTDMTQDITLPFVTISGRTIDSNGVPVSGVSVRFKDVRLPSINGGGVYHYGGAVTSDISGNYSFSVYPYSDHTLTLRPPASATGVAVTALTSVDLSADDNTRDLQLLKGVTLNGTVYLPDGITPASNVSLSMFDSSSPSTYLNGATTDATGRYSVTVAPGTYGFRMDVPTSSNEG